MIDRVIYNRNFIGCSSRLKQTSFFNFYDKTTVLLKSYENNALTLTCLSTLHSNNLIPDNVSNVLFLRK
jgi:hypothetical protein